MESALKLMGESRPVKNNYINYRRVAEVKSNVLMIDFIRTYIIRKQRNRSRSFGDNYETLIVHLKRFSQLNNVELYTNSINEEFGDDFIIYLIERGSRKNYISHILNMLISMCNKAVKSGYLIDSTYSDIHYEKEETNGIYISMMEIAMLYAYNGLTRFQERIRDQFIVGCLTGLRYSDYSVLGPENFVNNRIVKVQKKTGKKVLLPVHDLVKMIYIKYDGKIGTGLSAQYFNRAIKEICKKAGLNRKVTITYTRGKEKVMETKEQWELISSHTARRSMVTNMVLTGRFKFTQVMAVSGHSTEKSAIRYLRSSQDEIIDQIANDPYFKL